MRYLDLDTAKRISKIGLGTWQFGSRDWGYGENYHNREARDIVRRALDLGVTLFDTGEIYGAGDSERILGEALGDRREDAAIATKLFPVLPGAPMVKRRALASAIRLGTPHLDIYQVHWPNPLISDRTIMRAMRALQHARLVGDVGVSKYSLERWRRADSALGTRVLSNQVGYSLVDRSPEEELIPFAETEGRLIIAFAPLAHGLLSGNYHGSRRPSDQLRREDPRFGADYLDRTRRLLTAMRDVAEAHGSTVAQIALAWVIRSPAVAAIPGASSVAQLEENVAAADIHLSAEECEALDALSAPLTPARVPSRSARRLASQARQNVRQLSYSRYLVETMWRDHRLERS